MLQRQASKTVRSGSSSLSIPVECWEVTTSYTRRRYAAPLLGSRQLPCVRPRTAALQPGHFRAAESKMPVENDDAYLAARIRHHISARRRGGSHADCSSTSLHSGHPGDDSSADAISWTRH